MRAFAQTPEATRETTSAKPVMLKRAGSAPSRAVNSILRLQRTVGNRVVQRHVQAASANADRPRPDIQLSSLKDFAGKPQRQAFLIDDAEIEATDEFKKY